MATRRTRTELLALRIEAERLVREGVARAEVSRVLGVHLQTLAQWALAGGWRRKDIEAETEVSDARRTFDRIETARDRIDAETARQLRLEAATHSAVHTSAHSGENARTVMEDYIRRLGGAAKEIAGPEPTTDGALISAHPGVLRQAQDESRDPEAM